MILYTGGADCRILAWDVNNGEIIKEFLTGHTACIQDLLLSKDEKNLFSCGREGRINRWNTDNGKLM